MVDAVVIEAGKTAQNAEGGRDYRDYGQCERSSHVELPPIDHMHVIAILAFVVIDEIIAICHNRAHVQVV